MKKEIGWADFFPPGSRVLALPNWTAPRVYLPAGSTLHSWKGSAFYPAVRLRAKLYRLSLRLAAVAHLSETRVVTSEKWPLGEFVQDTSLGHVSTVVVRTDRNDPARKATIQLWNKDSKVAGYLKYAEGALVRARLHREHRILRELPEDLGPTPLKGGPLGDGWGLLLTPVSGRMLPATLPPAGKLVDFLRLLEVHPPVPIEVHPWARVIRERSMVDVDPWLDALTGRDWSVVVQHGDFVPWNILQRPDGSFGAVDWEYGALEGLPFLDLVYNILQVAALVRRWKPSKAARYAIDYLNRESQLGLSIGEARASVRLTAYDAYLKALEYEESTPYEPSLQRWRRALWEKI